MGDDTTDQATARVEATKAMIEKATRRLNSNIPRDWYEATSVLGASMYDLKQYEGSTELSVARAESCDLIHKALISFLARTDTEGIEFTVAKSEPVGHWRFWSVADKARRTLDRTGEVTSTVRVSRADLVELMLNITRCAFVFDDSSYMRELFYSCVESIADDDYDAQQRVMSIVATSQKLSSDPKYFEVRAKWIAVTE